MEKREKSRNHSVSETKNLNTTMNRFIETKFMFWFYLCFFLLFFSLKKVS